MHITQRQLKIIGGGAGLIIILVAFLMYALQNNHSDLHSDTMATDEVPAENTAPEEQTDPLVIGTSKERSFIEEMIPHHQEAIDSAQLVMLRGGSTPAIKTLAQSIITTQTKEIADMVRWYQSWYGVPYQDTDTYTPMMGDLSNLSGVALDTAFLTDMVDHHLHAIMMAQGVAPFITRPEIEILARSIAAEQSNEIVTMKTILKQL
jgi:uncharacterized protein (DUF305 family)